MILDSMDLRYLGEEFDTNLILKAGVVQVSTSVPHTLWFVIRWHGIGRPGFPKSNQKVGLKLVQAETFQY